MNRTIAGVVLAGLALASPAAVADPDHEVQAECEYATQTFPGNPNGITHIVGHAEATKHAGVAATSVRCVLRDVYTNVVVYDETWANSGPVAVLVDHVQYRVTSLEVCAQGSALWNDNHVETSALVCWRPV